MKKIISLFSIALLPLFACAAEDADIEGAGKFASTHQQSDGGSYHVDALPQTEHIIAGELFDVMVTVNLDDGEAEFPEDLELAFAASSGEMTASVGEIHHPEPNMFHLHEIDLHHANVEWDINLALSSGGETENVSFVAIAASMAGHDDGEGEEEHDHDHE